MTSQEAKEKLTKLAEEKGFGHKKVNYKLRDWLFSRQRYWGEPIPLIHLETEDIENLPRVESVEGAKEKNVAYVLQSSSQHNTSILNPFSCEEKGATETSSPLAGEN